jgi:hypothetical protein
MDLNRTLDEVEGQGWTAPDITTPLMQRVRALGRVPLREFTAEDYRLIIGQHRALGTLLPLALLENEPFGWRLLSGRPSPHCAVRG